MIAASKLQGNPETQDVIDIRLAEWQKVTPDTHPVLKDFSFKNDLPSRKIAEMLTQSGKVEFLELAGGLQIRTTSFVGSFRLGCINLNIQPKIDAKCLLNLLRYAYGLRDIHLYSTFRFSLKEFAFQDLLIYQVVLEVEELLMRGLIRRYQHINSLLASPTGKINFLELSRQGGLHGAALPCIPHYRLENCIHNQVILSGLRISAWMTNDLELRARVRRLAGLFDDSIAPIEINQSTLARVDRESNRQSDSYNPAITLIKLLFKDQGIESGGAEETILLNGYLFDMNLFFQSLISRFLKDYLVNFMVEEQHDLKGLLTYGAGYNLAGRRDPIPRPDFAILKNGKVISLIDTKYRDLWNQGLPRDMLYQLVVYALAQEESRKSIIVYPTTEISAKEARINVNEPNRGIQFGMVVLKPINLIALEQHIRENNLRELEQSANSLINSSN